jgi:tetratricopeptide (TPR) repeat protein
MSDPSGRAAARTALDHLCHWHLRGATGTLALEIGDRSRRLHLVDGALHLVESSGIVERLRQLTSPGPDPSQRGPWVEVLARIGAGLDDGRVRFAEFHSGHSRIPADLFGPLPTRTLLRTGYAGRARQVGQRVESSDRDDEQRITVRPGAVGMGDLLGWSPEELWVLERLRAPMSRAELAEDCPFPEDVLVETLAGMTALGDVVAAEESVGETSVTIRELASRLSERVAASLRERPLDVDPEDYRSRVTDLLARVGGLAHEELLEVAPNCSSEELQDAFEELGRWVHPETAERYGLRDHREALSFLFERASEAYRVLADPQLRVAYLGTRQVSDTESGEMSEERRSEARQVARHLFDLALYDESIDEIHTALQLLEQAVRTDPKAEYWIAMGRLQARNPAWTSRAIESYRNALELDSRSGEVRFALGSLYETADDLKQARYQYRAAAAASPPHAGAQDALSRLAEADVEEGRLSRLFRRD